MKSTNNNLVKFSSIFIYVLRTRPNELLKLIIITIIIIPFNSLFSLKRNILFTSYKDNTSKKGQQTNKNQTKIKTGAKPKIKQQ
jgi:hypothetical protein